MSPKLRERYLKYIGEKFKNWDRIYLAWLEIGHVCSQNTHFFIFQNLQCIFRGCVCVCVCTPLIKLFFLGQNPFYSLLCDAASGFSKAIFPFFQLDLGKMFHPRRNIRLWTSVLWVCFQLPEPALLHTQNQQHQTG